MSFLLTSATAMVLSCGLSATPDGQPAPDGQVVMMNTAIPDNLAASLASGSPPPTKMVFTGEGELEPEWIVGMKSDPAKGTQISRLSHDVFGYKIRIGWALEDSDGRYNFTPTSSGTCQIKTDAAPARKATQ